MVPFFVPNTYSQRYSNYSLYFNGIGWYIYIYLGRGKKRKNINVYCGIQYRRVFSAGLGVRFSNSLIGGEGGGGENFLIQLTLYMHIILKSPPPHYLPTYL